MSSISHIYQYTLPKAVENIVYYRLINGINAKQVILNAHTILISLKEQNKKFTKITEMTKIVAINNNIHTC